MSMAKVEMVWEMRKGHRAWWEGLQGSNRERVHSKGGVELGQVRGGHVGSNGLASSSAQVSALAPCGKGNNRPSNNSQLSLYMILVLGSME